VTAATIRFPLIRKIVLSSYLDVFGAILILVITLYKGFHQTVYFQGEIQFGIPVNELWSYIMKGAYPLGVLSTIGAVFSMLSTRLIGKQNNIGNGIGVATTVNSGLNDFLFGNLSAVITYPFSFFLNAFATLNWRKGIYLRRRDGYYYLINLGGLLLGYLLVYLGFKLFEDSWDMVLFHSISITFGLSLGANLCTALKYKETWLSWIIYNFFNLVKNIVLGNIANVVKYVFYLFNSIVTLTDWKVNGDRK
jgi:nicotinamide mononucleotide transporter